MSELFTFRSVLSGPAREVFAWLAAPDSIRELIRESDRVVVVKTAEATRKGATSVFRVKAGPFGFQWVAEHVECEDRGDAGGSFVDVQKEGPFSSWRHRHEVTARGTGTCLVEDRIDYDLPGWIFGRLIFGGFVRKKLESMFAWRHSVMSRKFGRPSTK